MCMYPELVNVSVGLHTVEMLSWNVEGIYCCRMHNGVRVRVGLVYCCGGANWEGLGLQSNCL